MQPSLGSQKPVGKKEVCSVDGMDDAVLPPPNHSAGHLGKPGGCRACVPCALAGIFWMRAASASTGGVIQTPDLRCALLSIFTITKMREEKGWSGVWDPWPEAALLGLVADSSWDLHPDVCVLWG